MHRQLSLFINRNANRNPLGIVTSSSSTGTTETGTPVAGVTFKTTGFVYCIFFNEHLLILWAHTFADVV